MNVVWILFAGLPLAVSNFLTGAATCLTIIGIPFGIQHFKYASLVFKPSGQAVATKFSRHLIMNTLWLLCGGAITAIYQFLLAGLYFVTIIGIPIGKEIVKLAVFNLAPFGCEIIEENKYSEKRDTIYDAKLLCRRVLANIDLGISQSNGNEVSFADYSKKHFNVARRYRMATKIAVFLPLVILFAPSWISAILENGIAGAFRMLIIFEMIEILFAPVRIVMLPLLEAGPIGVLIIVLSGLLFCFYKKGISDFIDAHFINKHISELYRYYPEDSAVLEDGMRITEIICELNKEKSHKIHWR